LSLLTVILCFSLASAAGDPDPKVLKVALLPDESPSTVIKTMKDLKIILNQGLAKD